MTTRRTIKALCVREPWASLLVRGLKTAEIRSGRTHYRGELLIVASQQPDLPAVRLWATAAIPLSNLGMAIGIVDLADCVPYTEELKLRACHPRIVAPAFNTGVPWAWLMGRGARRIEPFPVKGRLGLFDVHGFMELEHIV